MRNCNRQVTAFAGEVDQAALRSHCRRVFLAARKTATGHKATFKATFLDDAITMRDAAVAFEIFNWALSGAPCLSRVILFR